MSGRTFGVVWAMAAIVAAMIPARAPAQEIGRPRLTVPRIARPPVIDGSIGADEWRDAAAVTGFIGAQGEGAGRMVRPDARIFLAHDGVRLYAAVECDLLPGQIPSRSYRRRDDPVYMDSNQVEIWLTPPAATRLTAFQTIANAYGAVYDKRMIPDLGAEQVAWNGRWTVKSSFTPGEKWTAELSVPFEDFDRAPVRPDAPWGGLVAVAWPQRSWPYTGGWYKNLQNHALFTFSDRGTCARLEDMSALLDGRSALKIALANPGDAEGEFTVWHKVGETEETAKVKVSARGRVALRAHRSGQGGASQGTRA